MKNLLFGFLLFFFNHTIGQEMIVKSYNPENGFPSSEVYSLIEDSKGYIWFATNTGLLKYDGINYEYIIGEDGEFRTTVLHLFEDQEGTVWYLTLGNKLGFIRNDSAIIYQFDIDENSIDYLSGIGLEFHIDSTGKKWLFNKLRGFLFKETSKDKFKPLHELKFAGAAEMLYYIKDLGNNNIASIFKPIKKPKKQANSEVKDGWIILQFPDSFYKQGCIPDFRFSKYSKDQYLGYDQSGNYVIFTSNRVLKFGHLGITNIIRYYQDSQGNHWFLTNAGVYYSTAEQLLDFTSILEGRFITAMTQDYEGNYWFADHNEGIHFIANTNFYLLDVTVTTPKSKIVNLKINKGKLWFATIDGEIWNVDSMNSYERIYHDQRPSYDYYPFDFLPNGNLFLPGGLIVKDGQIKDAGSQLHYTAFKAADWIDDSIFVAMSNGLAVFSDEGTLLRNTFTKYLNVGIEFEDSFGVRSNCVLKDNASNGYWVGTVQGLIYRVGNRTTNMDRINPLLGNRVLCIKNFQDNFLLLGTKGKGLLVFNKQTNSVQQIDKSSGISGNVIYDIYWDGQFIYLGTNHGLTVFQLDENQKVINLNTYDNSSSLPSNTINTIVGFANKIWIGTNDGLVYINNLKINDHSPELPVYIKYVNQERIFDEENTSITFKKGLRDVSIQFNAIGHVKRNSIKYKYYLSNSGSDTVYTDNPNARYTKLGPGDYTFYVWAKKSGGTWSKEPASIDFSVPPYFKETYLARIIYALLFALMIWLIIYLISRRKRLELKRKLNSVELKQQALTALMNPHFIFNSLSAIQHLMHDNKVESASVFLARFAKLVRLNMNAVRKGYILVEDEFKQLELYLELEKLRLQEKLDYKINFDRESDFSFLSIPSMIIQPFIENSIWHGILPLKRNGEIIVSFKLLDENNLEVLISDNGLGVSDDDLNNQNNDSLSISINKERLKLLEEHHGIEFLMNISKTDATNGGTTVHLILPVSIQN